MDDVLKLLIASIGGSTITVGGVLITKCIIPISTVVLQDDYKAFRNDRKVKKEKIEDYLNNLQIYESLISNYYNRIHDGEEKITDKEKQTLIEQKEKYEMSLSVLKRCKINLNEKLEKSFRDSAKKIANNILKDKFNNKDDLPKVHIKKYKNAFLNLQKATDDLNNLYTYNCCEIFKFMNNLIKNGLPTAGDAL